MTKPSEINSFRGSQITACPCRLSLSKELSILVDQKITAGGALQLPEQRRPKFFLRSCAKIAIKIKKAFCRRKVIIIKETTR